MAGVSDKIQELERRRALVARMGGEEPVARQHEKGKLSAPERMAAFFDPHGRVGGAACSHARGAAGRPL